MTSVMEPRAVIRRILIVVKNMLRSMALAPMIAGLFLAGAAGAEDPSKLPQPTSYVSDFASAIDANSQAQMEALSRQLHEKANATIEIVTIKSLDGQDIDEFTTALEDKWKVGAKSTDKGILMVFAMAEHKDRIEVGYGLEGILNDAKVGDIRRSMHDQLAGGSIGPGILFGEQQIANVIAKDANVTLDTEPVVQHQYHREPVRRRGSSWPGILIFIVIVLILSRGGRGGGWGWFLLGNMMGGGFGGGGRDNDRGGWGGGGGGGGDDFGGGFGGGSGGGGASGDW